MPGYGCIRTHRAKGGGQCQGMGCIRTHQAKGGGQCQGMGALELTKLKDEANARVWVH